MPAVSHCLFQALRDNAGMPKYLKISRAFHLGKGISRAYSGGVVASDEAFFFVVGENALRAGFVHGGGAIGALVADLLERRLAPLDFGPHIVPTDLGELPESIAGHPDWPIRAKEGPLIVVPRRAVRSIRYSFWKWGIFLDTKTMEIRIEPPFFGRKRMFTFLAEAGWEIEGSPLRREGSS